MVRVIFMILLSLLATGCWDSSEIDQLAIVTASGLDVIQDGSTPARLLGSVQIARVSALGTGQSGGPTTPTGSTSAFVVEHGEGIDPIATLESIRRKLSRKMIMSHRQAIVLGEDLARQGLQPIMDEIVRNPESRLRTAVMIAYHTQAREILNLPYLLNRLPTEALSGLQKQGALTNQDAKNFIRCLSGKGDPYAIGVEPEKTQSAEEPSNFILRHIAVFQKDKLVGWLDEEDVSGFLWLIGQVKRQMTSVSLPGVPGTVDAILLKAHTHTAVRVVNGQPRIALKIQVEDDLAGSSVSLDLNQPGNLTKVHNALESQIKNQVFSCLNLLQKKYDADIAGFANVIYQQQPQLWYHLAPNWRKEFRTLPVDVKVSVMARRAGYVGSTVKTPKEES